LKYDALYPDASKVTVLANNHDTTRFMSLEGATTAGAKMHVAFVLSVRGIPQLYAGEEIAMEGKEDPDNRRDFPTRAYKIEGRDEKERQMFDWTRARITMRHDYPALRSGKLIDLFSDDETYVFARQLGKQTIVVAFNRENKTKVISLPVGSIGVRDGVMFTSLFGPMTNARVFHGQVRVSLAPQTPMVFGFH
jgi:glycosidase